MTCPPKQAYEIWRGTFRLRFRDANSRFSKMGRKHTYATKAQLETLVQRMHRTGILYSEALEEFRRQFILVVLRDSGWNKSKAARELRMHRSTLVRALREFNIDIHALRNAERRPPHTVGVQQKKKTAG